MYTPTTPNRDPEEPAGLLLDVLIRAGLILGRPVGATLLAIGDQIFMGWVAAAPERRRPAQGGDSGPAA
jgi:hypothetical protein